VVVCCKLIKFRTAEFYNLVVHCQFRVVAKSSSHAGSLLALDVLLQKENWMHNNNCIYYIHDILFFCTTAVLAPGTHKALLYFLFHMQGQKKHNAKINIGTTVLFDTKCNE